MGDVSQAQFVGIGLAPHSKRFADDRESLRHAATWVLRELDSQGEFEQLSVMYFECVLLNYIERHYGAEAARSALTPIARRLGLCE